VLNYFELTSSYGRFTLLDEKKTYPKTKNLNRWGIGACIGLIETTIIGREFNNPFSLNDSAQIMKLSA
jgi:hypothetical protein